MTPTQLAQLNLLKQMLLSAPDTADALGAVLRFFLEQVATPAFVALSQPTTSAEIDQVLRDFSALPEVFGKAVRKTNTPLRQVQAPGYTFIHGDFTMRQKAGVVLFFDDVRKGLVALRVDAAEFLVRTFTRPSVVNVVALPTGS